MLEKQLTTVGGKFIAGNTVTIADFILAAHIHNNCNNPNSPFNNACTATIQTCPKLKAYIVVNKTEFKNWNNKRPNAGPW